MRRVVIVASVLRAASNCRAGDSGVSAAPAAVLWQADDIGETVAAAREQVEPGDGLLAIALEEELRRHAKERLLLSALRYRLETRSGKEGALRKIGREEILEIGLRIDESGVGQEEFREALVALLGPPGKKDDADPLRARPGAAARVRDVWERMDRGELPDQVAGLRATEGEVSAGEEQAEGEAG